MSSKRQTRTVHTYKPRAIQRNCTCARYARRPSTDLDPLGQQLVAGECVPLVERDAEGGGAGEGEVGAVGGGGGVGILQLSAQLQAGDARRHVARAHLHGLAVLRDHLLFLLHFVVDDGELGTGDSVILYIYMYIWKSDNTNARLMAFAPSLALDPTFGIDSHKTLDTAQPCHLLKPN